MASNLPSSFASAAAGQSSGRDSRGRGDGRGPEWSRRDGRSSNGTLTFRRASATPQSLSQSSNVPEPVMPTSPADSTLASQITTTSSNPSAARYSKDQLLDLFRTTGGPKDDVSHLFMDGWHPGAGHINGSANRGWGKTPEYNTGPDSDLCWNGDADARPLGLQDMSADEKELFQNDVNSPMKPPPQNKDGNQAAGANGRKASLSHGSGNPYNLTSPTSGRPGTRRRESTEPSSLSAGLSSPTTGGNRFGRDDGSPWFSRKPTDPRGEKADVDSDNADSGRDIPQSKPSFGSLLRGTSSASPGGISSLWPPSTSQPAPTGITGSGMGSFGNFALPSQNTAKPFSGNRGESRLAHLIPKESSENIGRSGDSSNPDPSRPWRSRPRTDTDPFGDEGLSGSGLLSAVRDSTPPVQGQPGQGPFDSAARGAIGDLGLSGLQLGQSDRDHTPLSPSDTNPYRSPPAERHTPEGHDDDFEKRSGGIDQLHSFRNPTPRGGYQSGAFDGSDRSQTSSAGPNRYPTLSSLGGWPAPPSATAGTPDRERSAFGSAFGNTLFSPVGEGLGGLGGVFGPPNAGGTGSIGRGSKLGSLFPAAMQAQMQGQDQESLADSVPDLRQNNPLGAIGRGSMAGPGREGDAARQGQSAFDDVFGSADAARRGLFGTGDTQPGLTTAAQQSSFTSTTPGAPFAAGQPSGDAPPAAQVRQMVMPDRMRWVYLDPQGQVQGPFTGLEMNDWYKANFFTPDLRVKKIEDSDFEPLGQLIRRIGNSREPFLVPQIGIPHGPAPQGNAFSPAGNASVVPPLSGVFPSYGRTLTADEQNNLERRKQEEQILMAQQREFILRQQNVPKFPMPGAGGVSGSLNHTSSAQSLQSQPSFGSISSPIGPPGQGAVGHGAPGSGAMFDSNPAAQSGSASVIGSGIDAFQEHDLAHLTTPERQVVAALQDSSGLGAASQSALAGLRNQLPATNQLSEDPQGFRERLLEFEQLRAGVEAEARAQMSPHERESFEAEESVIPQEQSPPAGPTRDTPASSAQSKNKSAGDNRGPQAKDLSQRAQQSPEETQSTGMPMPFPPPEPLEGEVTEAVPAEPPQPPPMAPWAKEASSEAHRGPSLKEIQEAEAQKAAKAEQVAQAARRAALEQEAAELREKERAAAAAAVAPGLPTSSTWGQASPANATSPWAKPAAPKTTGASGLSAAAQAEKKRKTLAEIQREEEARKQKARESAGTAAGGVPVSSAGKRYADLASKPNPPGMPQANASATPIGGAAGWATVGAGGKVKAPPGPSPQPRAASASAPKPAAKPVVKPVVTPAAPKPDGATAAMEEFKKWLHRELSRGITGVSNIDDFASTLLLLPLDTEMISDAVYANSTTMNGQHFAEEFIRRKKLADKGIAEKQPGSDGKIAQSGGWNEVAKKSGHAAAAGGAKEEAAVGFRVVPGRKKGKK